MAREYQQVGISVTVDDDHPETGELFDRLCAEVQALADKPEYADLAPMVV